MTERHYLDLLAKEYPSADAVSAEIIKMLATNDLPKGTEYFFSDIHGEADAFSYLVGTASGNIREKIESLFQNSVPEPERALLSALIYRPEEVLAEQRRLPENDDWYRINIYRLVQVCKLVASKYSRSKVRQKMPQNFAHMMDELLHADTEENKEDYYTAIISAIVATGIGDKFIVALCRLIRQSSIDKLHIIGDIYDRGPHADLVMEELAMFNDVDIQWGNHDIHWMGAAAGSETCVASVVRLAISYNNFDLLEDSYNINLRPLSSFAAEVYGNDPCLPFRPHLLDTNIYDPIDSMLAAKMHKAIAIIQFKLEGQLIARHPEYNMQNRALLLQVDYTNGTIQLEGKTYPLRDSLFPTVDPLDPLRLTPGEEELVHTLTRSFTHSAMVQRHIRYLYNKGSIYKTANNNLLYHGCIPMQPDGTFLTVTLDGTPLAGKALLDAINTKVRAAYFAPQHSAERNSAQDYLWYLWCGPDSPIFGKSRLTTFERYFIEDAATHTEQQNPYYHHVNNRAACEMILREFGLNPETCHIVNGHVPVRISEGESPIKAGGLLFVIDGGISKAYQGKTGIGGYTLISNSHSLLLAQHRPFEEIKQSQFRGGPRMQVVERFPSRLKVRDTDAGRALQIRILELNKLLAAYREGVIQEQE